jgi:hypothetical protein
MSELKRLVIHCTATREGREVSGAEIRHWHTSPKSKGGRGWKQVGYSDLIHLNGGVENLVPYNEDQRVDPWEVTNGAKGYNSTSLHVVYVGGVGMNNQSRDTRTAEQRRSMERYVRNFHRQHPQAEIVGHRDLPGAATDCPGFDVKRWLKEIGLRN